VSRYEQHTFYVKRFAVIVNFEVNGLLIFSYTYGNIARTGMLFDIRQGRLSHPIKHGTLGAIELLNLR
jgi:hypothetical protein